MKDVTKAFDFQDLYSDALYRGSVVHHNHSIKAALCIQNLMYWFPHWPDSVWLHAQEIITGSQLKIKSSLLDQMEYMKLSDTRIQRVLRRSLFPLAYQAMWQWIERAGFNTVFNKFLEDTLVQNDYLLHRISVLLTFEEVQPLLKSDIERKLVVERFTEFICSAFYDVKQLTYPIVPGEEADLQNLSYAKCLPKVLEKPGYYGHHLIALCWVEKMKRVFKPVQFEKALASVYEHCFWAYEYDEDKVDLSDLSTEGLTMEDFEPALMRLLTVTHHNIHQITLGEAIAFTWQRLESEDLKLRLIALAQYFQPKA